MLIGLDVGTTRCKAVAHDEQGRALAAFQRPTPWTRVATGAELAPPALASTCLDLLRDCARVRAIPRVAAVGITSVAECGVVLAADGRPLAPIVAWYDERGATDAAQLRAALGPEYHRRTGLPLSHVQSISTYRWLRRHRPDVAARGVRWLNVAEWLVHVLGGDQLGERSLASRTGWFDVSAATPWSAALAAVDAPAGLLPAVASAGTLAGRANDLVPELRGAALAIGGHDHLCAAVGAGATSPGDVLHSCGTAQAVIAPIAARSDGTMRAAAVARGLTVGWHAIPDRQAIVAAFPAGRGLARVERIVGAGITPAALDDAALHDDGAAAPRDHGAPRDGTALRGAPAPTVAHPDPDQTTISGIHDSTTPGQIWRAALEAAEQRATALTSAVVESAGPAARTVAVGGWVRRRAFVATKRAHQVRLVVPDVAEAGARGAALLAGCAAGLFAGVDDLPAPSEAAPDHG